MSGQFEDGEYADQSGYSEHGEGSGLDTVVHFVHYSILHEEEEVEGHHCQQVEDVQHTP